MRWQIIFATVSSAVCLGASAPQAGKSDQDALQGSWQLVKGEKQGKEVSKEEINKVNMLMTIKDNTLQMKGKDSSGKEAVEQSGTFKLDSSQLPKHIDLVDKKNGDVMVGIYELNGDDLKICGAGSMAARPTDFKSNDVMFFKRVKK